MVSNHPSPSETTLTGSDHERLSAARGLAHSPDPEMIATIRRTLAVENVPWVRTALRQALRAAEDQRPAPIPFEPEEPDNDEPASALDRRQIYADALHETTRRILHEITPIIGRARVAAEREVDADGRLQHELDLLSNVCTAISGLADATSVPELTELDLAPVLHLIATTESAEAEYEIRGSGAEPFIAVTDQGFIEIAVRNILRNAVEASAELVRSPDLRRPIDMRWGHGPDSYWISVIDRGPGPPSGKDLFHIGASTKEGHPGFGLGTTEQAMKSLGGTVELSNNEHGGATVILTWPALASSK